MLNVLQTLLLLALLAITGEAAAMHCGGSENAQHGETSHHQATVVAEPAPTHAIADTAEQEASCSHGQCGTQHTEPHTDTHTKPSSHTDCDGSCACCPGHCANCIPASVQVAEFHSFARSVTAYRPLDSTPAPESSIRPPITA
ncbi:hypothetical protein [Microbulbifer agarilyticus]|uniref:hypothetical protein n=1 Tax=Microbulbifer agarilyticus TaxID=260552 RepID=UPI001C95CD5C|nr:hypothetical protein [Microbulbifer agarilyticus]MBY6192034.1 hypothetical protein [Microbulbifer agarilyticus]MBY6213068.1 hypothetical protein [Microbulbifer agarilyticus]MCA0894644.1 hypothetical protein [Microbulbifer agarilyticus]